MMTLSLLALAVSTTALIHAIKTARTLKRHAQTAHAAAQRAEAAAIRAQQAAQRAARTPPAP